MKSRISGATARALMTIAIALWAFWGVAEMYYGVQDSNSMREAPSEG